MTISARAPAADLRRQVPLATANAAHPLPGDHRPWSKKLARYREPSLARSLAEPALTAVPFAVSRCLMTKPPSAWW
jgi:hypothetical protein